MTPAHGKVRDDGSVQVSCTFDDETFAQIRALAVEEKVPLTEAIRQLVEWGLMESY